MENKLLSKLNITKLKHLLNTCALEEKPTIEKRIKILQDRNKAKKNISPWSDNSSIEDIPIEPIKDTFGRKTVDINTATRMLREYYASKYGNGVNDVSKIIDIESTESPEPSRPDTGFLASLDKEFEVVEISIKLLKKLGP